MMTSILVTGGCGFIGANLVPMLVEKGYQVKVLDNLSRGRRSYLDGVDCEIIEGDITDAERVGYALKGVEGVIHLAAYGSVVESVENPRENFEINVGGTFTVLDQCRINGVRKLVFSSTGGALIGNCMPPVDETSLPRPISPYGSSKLCCEAYCSSFAASYGIDIVALRFANVIGPLSWHKKGAVTAFMKAIMNNEEIVIYGDGSATRDFLYVEDLCRGIILGYQKQMVGFNPIHLASGVEVSVKQLAESIIRVTKVKSHSIKYLHKRVGEVDRNFANYDYAKSVLGFEPKFGLEDGLLKTWLSFIN